MGKGAKKFTENKDFKTFENVKGFGKLILDHPNRMYFYIFLAAALPIPDDPLWIALGMVEKKKFNFREFYEKKYKLMLIIPIVMLVLAILQIGMQVANTGDFVNKGVSLKGGMTITVEGIVDDAELERYLNDNYPDADISVRVISKTGTNIGAIIEASDVDGDELVNNLIEKLELKED